MLRGRCQSQNSPANDEDITYSGGAGEVFTINPQGGVTIDTHAAQNPRAGTYFTLMATLSDGIDAFYKDLVNQGKIMSSVVRFSTMPHS